MISDTISRGSRARREKIRKAQKLHRSILL
jgi:hypothetical protein